MKKSMYVLFLCCVSLAFTSMLTGCSSHVEPIETTTSAQEGVSEQPTPEPSDNTTQVDNTGAPPDLTEQQPITDVFDDSECLALAEGNKPVQEGNIFGDLLYKNISISAFFEGHIPENILGALDSRSDGPYYYYDDLLIINTGSVDRIVLTNPGMFEIGGITLDKTREELADAFGNPIDHFIYEYPDHYNNSVIHIVRRAAEDNRFIVYHLSSDTEDGKFVFEFSFGSSDGKASSCMMYKIYPKEREDNLLSVDEAQVLAQDAWFGIGGSRATHGPGMHKHEGGSCHYGFQVDYGDIGVGFRAYTYTFAATNVYAWVNAATGEITFEENNLYDNIPDSKIPIPTLDGEAIPYDRFWPPASGFFSTLYVYADSVVVEPYEELLRNAGFIDSGIGWMGKHYWTYELGVDEVTLTVCMYPLGTGFVIEMYARKPL